MGASSRAVIAAGLSGIMKDEIIKWCPGAAENKIV
jgi:hypothetical protein